MRLEELLESMVIPRERFVYLFEFDDFDFIDEQTRASGTITEENVDYICKMSSEQRSKPSAYFKDKIAFAEVDRFIIGLAGTVYIFLRFSEDQWK